ncbi:hypothetical protein T4A_4446 [Trichinella pseudospiralis]|uniref:Uncharacterized protein n=1 Tax=Trichinella pseudospiralis TaxID=6337 RepID=A0A0V1ECI4_TRIPS|nr:hypothetical protein T4A_4446 [Trichinella pseudospiralis]
MSEHNRVEPRPSRSRPRTRLYSWNRMSSNCDGKSGAAFSVVLRSECSKLRTDNMAKKF